MEIETPYPLADQRGGTLDIYTAPLHTKNSQNGEIRFCTRLQFLCAARTRKNVTSMLQNYSKPILPNVNKMTFANCQSLIGRYILLHLPHEKSDMCDG